MGTPGIPARLRKIASVAGPGSSQHDQPQPVLVGQVGPNPAAEADARDTRQRSARVSGTGMAAAKVQSSDPDQTLPPKRGTTRGTRPRRGRPRSERADRDILLATLDVLAEKGMGGLSIEEVAARAGVGKTTIYRRWSSRGTLALDAFLAEFEGQQALPDTGSFAGDLRAALNSWVSAVSGTSAGKLLVGLIAEIQQDRNLAAAWQDQVIAPLRAQYSIMLDRAINRGEIPALTDAGVVLDLVFGACYYRLLHGHRPLNEQFVNQVVGVVAAGVGATTNLSREPCGSVADLDQTGIVSSVLPCTTSTLIEARSLTLIEVPPSISRSAGCPGTP